jgi:2'-5' RNA ligase
MRLFIAVELPDKIKNNIVESLREWQAREPGVKWVEAKNLHVTLKFLGWVEDRKVEAVIELTRKAVAGKGGFIAVLKGLGFFPPGEKPRVIWIGINEGGDQLKNLADNIEKHFSLAGFDPARREFSSHLTIGRVKEDKAFAGKIDPWQNVEFGEFSISSIAIIKSTLTPRGPLYEKIEEVGL